MKAEFPKAKPQAADPESIRFLGETKRAECEARRPEAKPEPRARAAPKPASRESEPANFRNRSEVSPARSARQAARSFPSPAPMARSEPRFLFRPRAEIRRARRD